MKLTQAQYNLELDLAENVATILVIENKGAMVEIVRDLIIQSRGGEGQFILSNNGKELKLNKNLDVVINPFEINLNEKRILTAMYKRLEESANEHIEDKEKLNGLMVNLLDEILETETAAFYDYDFELEWKDLFKLYNVRVADDTESLLELIVEYIKTVACYLGIRLVVFVGLDMFFSSKDLNLIISQANYCKVHLLLISARELDNICECNIYILDGDKCVIRKVHNLLPLQMDKFSDDL